MLNFKDLDNKIDKVIFNLSLDYLKDLFINIDRSKTKKDLYIDISLCFSFNLFNLKDLDNNLYKSKVNKDLEKDFNLIIDSFNNNNLIINKANKIGYNKSFIKVIDLIKSNKDLINLKAKPNKDLLANKVNFLDYIALDCLIDYFVEILDHLDIDLYIDLFKGLIVYIKSNIKDKKILDRLKVLDKTIDLDNSLIFEIGYNKDLYINNRLYKTLLKAYSYNFSLLNLLTKS